MSFLITMSQKELHRLEVIQRIRDKRLGVVQAAEDIHQGRLAGTGGADDRHQLATVDLQVDTPERQELAVAGEKTAADTL